MQAQVEFNGCVFPLKEITWLQVLDACKKLGVDVSADDFCVSYFDDEDQLIQVKNDLDLPEAIRVATAEKRPVLALKVSRTSARVLSDDDVDVDSDDDREWQHWDAVDDNMSVVSSRVLLGNRNNNNTQATLLDSGPLLLRSYDDAILSGEAQPCADDTQEAVSSAPEIKENKDDGESSSLPRESQHAPSVQDEEPPVVLQEPAVPPVVLQEPAVPPVVLQEPLVPPEVQEPIVPPAQQSAVPPSSPFNLETLFSRVFHVGMEATTGGLTLRQTAAEVLSKPETVAALCKVVTTSEFQAALVQVAQKARDGQELTMFAPLVLGPLLMSAMIEAPELGRLIPYVIQGGFFAAEKKSPEQAALPKVVHARVTCDGCGKNPIEGVRFKSSVLPDFDLCESCERSGRFQQRAGPFLKICTATEAPDAILCVVRGAGSAARENLDWRNPLAQEFREFLDRKTQQSFETTNQQRTAPQVPAQQPAAVRESLPVAQPVVVVGDAAAPPVVVVGVPPPARTCTVTGCKGNHVLQCFQTLHGGYLCNVCGKKESKNATMYGCRPCDYDVCMACVETGSFRTQRQPDVRATNTPGSAVPQAKFISDVTLSDGCIVSGGEHTTKIWRVRNSGTEAWPAGTRIMHVGGDPMGGPLQGADVPLANPGEAVNVAVQLIMPHVPGRYTSYWRLVSPSNVRFGHRFWCTVVVAPPAPRTTSFAYPSVVPRPRAAWAPPPPPVVGSRVNPPPPPPVVVAAPVQSAPPAAEEAVVVPEWMEENVAKICDLGFNDVDKIVRFLREENGNTTNVIDRLLSGS